MSENTSRALRNITNRTNDSNSVIRPGILMGSRTTTRAKRNSTGQSIDSTSESNSATSADCKPQARLTRSRSHATSAEATGASAQNPLVSVKEHQSVEISRSVSSESAYTTSSETSLQSEEPTVQLEPVKRPRRNQANSGAYNAVSANIPLPPPPPAVPSAAFAPMAAPAVAFAAAPQPLTVLPSTGASASASSNGDQLPPLSVSAAGAGGAASTSQLDRNPVRKVIPRVLPRSTRTSNFSFCQDYLEDMIINYYEQEELFAAKPYISRQRDINSKMRGILVDWLVEVSFKFKLQSSTLWLCINILDRFLEVVQIQRGKLQLIGISALFLASKSEEVCPPELKDCLYITDFAYAKEQVIASEAEILNALDYQIMVPTAFHFLNYYLAACQASDRTRFLAFYYAERNLQEIDMLEFKPHVIAAGAAFAALCQQDQHLPMARLTLVNGVAAGGGGGGRGGLRNERQFWTNNWQATTGFVATDLIDVAKQLVRHVSESVETTSKRRLIAARKKYQHEMFGCVSLLPLPSIE